MSAVERASEADISSDIQPFHSKGRNRRLAASGQVVSDIDALLFSHIQVGNERAWSERVSGCLILLSSINCSAERGN
jgi:hypothetical protein